MKVIYPTSKVIRAENRAIRQTNKTIKKTYKAMIHLAEVTPPGPTVTKRLQKMLEETEDLQGQVMELMEIQARRKTSVPTEVLMALTKNEMALVRGLLENPPPEAQGELRQAALRIRLKRLEMTESLLEIMMAHKDVSLGMILALEVSKTTEERLEEGLERLISLKEQMELTYPTTFQERD